VCVCVCVYICFAHHLKHTHTLHAHILTLYKWVVLEAMSIALPVIRLDQIRSD